MEQGTGEGIYVQKRDGGPPLDREETDVTQGQMAVYEGKRGILS